MVQQRVDYKNRISTFTLLHINDLKLYLLSLFYRNFESKYLVSNDFHAIGARKICNNNEGNKKK